MTAAGVGDSRRSGEPSAPPALAPGSRPAILIVAPQPFLADRGTPIATAQLAAALLEIGFDVDLLCYPMGREPGIAGLRVHRVPNPFGMKGVQIGFSARKVVLDVLMVPALRRLLRARRYAAIHAVEEAAFLAVAFRPAGVPVIYDMASSLPQQMAAARAVFRVEPVRSLLTACERWLLNRVDRVVCSRGLADYVALRAPGVPVAEWIFAPLAPADPDDVARLRAELGLTAADPVLVYTGSFAPYQGIDEVIRSAARVILDFPDARFVLVGADETRHGAALRLVEALGLARNVFVLGSQRRERMSLFLGIADILLLPRASGANLPLKLFDYLATGKPILATGDVMDLPEAWRGEVVRVKHDVNSIADGLRDMLAGRAAWRDARSRRGAGPESGHAPPGAEYASFVEGLFRDVSGPGSNAIGRPDESLEGAGG